MSLFCRNASRFLAQVLLLIQCKLLPSCHEETCHRGWFMNLDQASWDETDYLYNYELYFSLIFFFFLSAPSALSASPSSPTSSIFGSSSPSFFSSSLSSASSSDTSFSLSFWTRSLMGYPMN